MIEKKNKLRETTVININKEDINSFNEMRAKEGGRRGRAISQAAFAGFLISLYWLSKDEQKDAAWKSIEKKRGG
jgi:hypothetical protein